MKTKLLSALLAPVLLFAALPAPVQALTPTCVGDAPYIGQVLTAATWGLIVRSSPVTGARLGKLAAGECLQIDETETGIDGRVWLHIVEPQVGYVASWWVEYKINEAPAETGVVTPGLCRVMTDMELHHVYSIPTNYHSRTLLPEYKYLPGGETTATMRLQGGVGNVQYPPVWMNYVVNILNAGPDKKRAENYLFRKAGGIQNSDQKGRMEELTTEGNFVLVTNVSGIRAYLQTYHANDTPPTVRDLSDSRIQRITVVNRLDQLTRSTSFETYFPLMARPGEQLWIPIQYLSCPDRAPYQTFVNTPGSRLNVRAGPGIGWQVLTVLDDQTPVTVFETQADAGGRLWYRITAPGSLPGWVAGWLIR